MSHLYTCRSSMHFYYVSLFQIYMKRDKRIEYGAVDIFMYHSCIIWWYFICWFILFLYRLLQNQCCHMNGPQDWCSARQLGWPRVLRGFAFRVSFLAILRGNLEPVGKGCYLGGGGSEQARVIALHVCGEVGCVRSCVVCYACLRICSTRFVQVQAGGSVLEACFSCSSGVV